MHPAVDNCFKLSPNIKLQLKLQNYNIVFNLQGNPASMRLSLNTGQYVFKVRKDTLKKLILVNFKVNKLRDTLPVYAKYLKTIRIFNPEARQIYSITDNLETGTVNIQNGQYIVVSPSSKHFTKRLPADKFIEILKPIKAKIILTGDNNETDSEICGYIAQRISNAENLCGKLSFTKLAAYIKKSEFVVCNDSGVLHLAEALNKKVFVFFGSTVKEFGFYPQLNSTEIFESGLLDCRPCSHIGRNKCKKGHFRCMEDIDAERVKFRIKKFIDENIS